MNPNSPALTFKQTMQKIEKMEGKLKSAKYKGPQQRFNMTRNLITLCNSLAVTLTQYDKNQEAVSVLKKAAEADKALYNSQIYYEKLQKERVITFCVFAYLE